MRTYYAVAAILTLLFIANPVESTLIDRGNALVFDSVNNISWTKDGSISGQNNWSRQVEFANNLVLAGFDDFRLATIDELFSLFVQVSGGEVSKDITGNTFPFLRIPFDAWSSTEVNATDAYFFTFTLGKHAFSKDFAFPHGWAVRVGDSVTAVTEPASGLLIGLGLLVIRLARRYALAGVVSRLS